MPAKGWTGEVEAFEAREGGQFQISLRRSAGDGVGQAGDGQGDALPVSLGVEETTGRFMRLVPAEEVVQVLSFGAADPGLAGEMTITCRLARSSDGTVLSVRQDGLPPGVGPSANAAGWRLALGRLADLLQATEPARSSGTR